MPATLIEFPADDADRALRSGPPCSGVVLGAAAQRTRAPVGGRSRGGLRIGVHERGRGPGDTASLPYFSVGDMEAGRCSGCASTGGSVIHPGERWSICRDSEGSPFALAARLCYPVAHGDRGT